MSIYSNPSIPIRMGHAYPILSANNEPLYTIKKSVPASQHTYFKQLREHKEDLRLVSTDDDVARITLCKLNEKITSLQDVSYRRNPFWTTSGPPGNKGLYESQKKIPLLRSKLYSKQDRIKVVQRRV